MSKKAVFIFDYPDSCDECMICGDRGYNNTKEKYVECPLVCMSSSDISRVEMFLNRIKRNHEYD